MTHVLRHRDIRFLWLGLTISTLGDRLVTVALALFVIEETGSPTDLGLVLAAHSLPLVGFLLVGGVWADRLPRARVMIASDVVRCALHAGLAALIFTGWVEVWHLVVIEALFGTAEAFFRPAFSGLVPQTVPDADLQQANALTGLVKNLGEFVGPVLATALVLGVGAGWAFGFDAVTFLVSAVFLLGVRARDRGVAAADAPFGMLAELREGYGAVRSRPWVWVTVAAFGGALLVCLGPWLVLGPLVAEERYGSIGVYGAISAALGAGTLVGSVVSVRWRPRYPVRMAILVVLAWPVSAGAFALGLPLAVVVAATALAGVGIALFDVWWLTALGERIPPHLLSRVTSYDWLGSLALLPLGYVLAGPLGEALGATEVLLGGAVLGFVVLALALVPRETRMLERLPGAQPNSGVPSSGVEASA